MQGHDAPRPRAMAAHLRFCKQAAPRSSQTLHRNTALYLQENAQPRSERISLPLEGMQGRDAPCSRTTVAYLQLQISNIQPRSTLNRNIQPTPPPLEEMQGGTPCPRIAAAHFPLSKNKQRSDRFKQVIGALRSTLKRNAQPRGKRNPLPLEGVQGERPMSER